MTLKDVIKKVQKAIGVTDDGEWGPVTTAKADGYDIEVTVKAKPKVETPTAPAAKSAAPWLDEAQKYNGKSENDSVFNKFMSGFWKIVGLPGYKTIAGNSFAWCGLTVAAFLSIAGYQWAPNGAGARNWGHSTKLQYIDWKANGFPRGAIIHINHNANCSSGSSNHVTMSAGDCAPQDLKSGTIQGFGGNQGNKLTTSNYPVTDICEVGWPKAKTDGTPVPLPGKVLVSNGCKGGKYVPESTR